MNQLIKKLKKENLIEEELIIDCIKQNKIIDRLRLELVQDLEEKNEEKKEMYRELVEKEEKTLKLIKEIIKTPKFKRAYSLKENKDKIDYLLKYISKSEIEVTEGNKKFREIFNKLINILDNQTYLEKNKLKNIKKDVGEVIWNQFEDKFKSDEFLKLLSYSNIE
ncbi:hypothetical protein OW763_16030 [Clostridium aestuarii]|uniref:Uncharacterized protein n=1 Tax=Clostridium aestuarii TaxID=338193 RepID=A0ABT4D6L7_9CLOT|nr:hypothetical protein [Clostridium aestuarii]MCY6485830.1 hypothetical protein [Clostridium aestuarii]